MIDRDSYLEAITVINAIKNGDTSMRMTHEGELAAAVNSLSESIEKKGLEYNEFIATLVHDLKNPMTCISGFADALLDGNIKKDDFEKYIRVISEEAKRATSIANSILEITRAESESTKLSLSNFDVCELIRIVIISLEKQIEDKGLDIEFLPSMEKCIVCADKDAIHRVIYNILHNAIKFSYQNGKIAISVIECEEKYTVSIYNTGNGLSSTEIANVFSKFYRAEYAKEKDKSGTGLGLAIVDAIIRKHGEKIEVKSVEGEYCEFKFSLNKGS